MNKRFACSRPSCGQLLERAELVDNHVPYPPQCPHCLGFVVDRWVPLVDLACAALFFACAIIVGTLLAALLSGCGGPAFTASELELAGAGAGGVGGLQQAELGGAGAGGSSLPPVLPGGAGGAGGGEPVAGAAGTFAPCELAGTATAFASWTSGDGGPPSSAVDGSSSTRWASGVPQAAGQWFQVTLPAPRELERITIAARPGDMPATVALELDGVPIAVTLSSSTGLLELEFPPRWATVVRLELEQPATSWWSIDELTGECAP